MVRGAPVLVTPARPAISLRSFGSLSIEIVSLASSLAKVSDFVLSYGAKSITVPITKSGTRRIFSDWSRN